MKRESQYRSSMLKSLIRLSAWAWVIILGAAIFSQTGCAKQRAGLSLNKARKLLQEAERREALRLEPDSYATAKKEIEETERLMAEKQYKSALTRASSSVDRARNVLEATLSKLAAQRLNEAKDALDVANRNHGVQIDLQRYNKVKDFYDRAQEKQRKNKWVDAIDLSEKEMREVETLLASLLIEAKQRQMSAQNKFDEMKAIGAMEYAQEYVVTAQDMLRSIEQKIKVERDYLGARNQANDTIRKCEEGITATKGKMAQEQISKIEDGLAEAVNKGAPIYAKDLLKTCNDTFDAIIKQFSEKKYDDVLEMDQSLNSAREQFKNEKFEDSENLCLTALREGQKIRESFNDYALDAMRNASESLEIARNVFDKTQDIFIIRPDLNLTGLDLQFERKKQAIRAELDTIINRAQLTLRIAKLRQEEGKYRKAIELAGEVKRTGEYALNETYHVVAHNAIMELAEQITRRETDGARQYVPEELDHTRKLLEQAKSLLGEEKYKEAVRKAGEARAQLEITTQELAQKAVENMTLARKQIADSQKNRTGEFQKGELERAQALLAEAEKALQNQNLKPAVETALQAATVAQAASIKSARLWCEQVMNEAKSSIAKAEEAGALVYAAEQLDEAKRFLNSARGLYESANYLEGKDVATRSVQKASDAFYKNILVAETAINEAKGYKGWDYKYNLLSKSIVNAKLARQSIESGDYSSSNAYAEKAAIEARRVVKDAKSLAFQKRVNDILNGLDIAMHSGVNYFQAENTKKIYRQVAEIREKFSLDNYDQTSSQLDKLEADLERLMTSTPEVLVKMISKQQERLANQAETKANDLAGDLMESAKDQLRYAKFDFDNKKFSQSYTELKDAITKLDEVDHRLVMETYSEKANEVLDNLGKTMDRFRGVLELGPTMVESFSVGPEGHARFISISSALPPAQFRATVTELYQKARTLEVPKGAEGVHESLIDMLNDIRLASIYFDKMCILDEFDPSSRHDIIYKAFDYINSAKQKRAELQNTFLNRDRKLRLAESPL
ncbi:MAG: DUF4398 domain-containing protein [Candidatus Sumerlaeota bacterium]|nr:DUF4398 domain-containing protein [Candidatus Sumerlaeota bacterium]